MKNLYIVLEDGYVIGHPFLEENLLMLNPIPDFHNIEKFRPFVRQPPPSLEELPRTDSQILESSYVPASDGVSYTDQYSTRELTQKEFEEIDGERRKSIDMLIQSMKTVAVEQLDAAASEVKQVWQGYLDNLNSFIYNGPFTTEIPRSDDLRILSVIDNLAGEQRAREPLALQGALAVPEIKGG